MRPRLCGWYAGLDTNRKFVSLNSFTSVHHKHQRYFLSLRLAIESPGLPLDITSYSAGERGPKTAHLDSPLPNPRPLDQSTRPLRVHFWPLASSGSHDGIAPELRRWLTLDLSLAHLPASFFSFRNLFHAARRSFILPSASTPILPFVVCCQPCL
jgi:hypothetical protein